MTGLQRWLAAGVWMAAIAGTVVTASENRWFYGGFAAVLVGVTIAFAWRWGTAGRRWWAAAAILSLACGIALYIAKTSTEPVCIAKNASDERVVIGTEFTERGRKYHEANPSDDNNAILEALGRLGPQEAWTADSIARCRLRLTITGALWVPMFGAALVCAVALMTPARDRAAEVSRRTARVFISYNHEDAAVAAKIRDLLVKNELDVILDVDSMAAGQPIQQFIEASIRDADVVVSIVSNGSLLSSWVAMETIHSFQRQKWGDGKLFVGCYLSDDYFRPEFRLECTRNIDQRLQTIERLIPEYQEKRIDPVDLNEEKTRLYELRNNLGTILATLKGSLCLDLRDAHFEESVGSLVATIKGLRCTLGRGPL